MLPAATCPRYNPRPSPASHATQWTAAKATRASADIAPRAGGLLRGHRRYARQGVGHRAGE